MLRATDTMALEGEVNASIVVQSREPGAASDVDTVVWIEGASDLLEYVETKVVGSTLHVGTRDGVRLDPSPSLEIRATRLVRLVAAGAGTVRVTGFGAGTDPTEACEIDAAGAVDVYGEGAVDRLEVRQAGSSDVHLEGLIAREIDHESTGVGDAWLHATERLRTTVVGVGDVHVLGEGTIEKSIVGPGSVRRGPVGE